MGGMAVVYRALDTRLNREVALKILLPQFVDDQTFLQRFLREGQNTKRLRHPNIVRTFDAGMIDEHYYIAMELIEGLNLAEYVKDQGTLLEFRETIDILSQVSAALDYAHSLGFLHRDIKLTNILISEDGRALLSDFGAAKHLSTNYTMLTTAGQAIGTPSYMSPEQARAEVNLDFRTDVYSLGVVAFKLFTGRMPYVAENQPELLYKVVYDEVPDPQVYNDDISMLLANVLKRVLSKQPQSRYESAGALISAIVASKRWRIDIAEDITNAAEYVPDSVSKKRSPWRGLSLAAGALATVIIVLALSSGVRTQDRQPSEMASIGDDMVNEAVSDVIGDVTEALPNVDLPVINIPEGALPSLTNDSDGQINVPDMGISGETLTEYWEIIPGRAEISDFGQSLWELLPTQDGLLDKLRPQSNGNEGQSVDAEEAASAESANGESANEESVGEPMMNKPPMIPILPNLPSP